MSVATASPPMPPKPPVGTARPYGKLATRLIVALEAEARDTIGREYYEHGAAPGSGYRNGVRPAV